MIQPRIARRSRHDATDTGPKVCVTRPGVAVLTGLCHRSATPQHRPSRSGFRDALKVLVIEYRDQVIAPLTASLDLAGIEVFRAKDGAEAVARCLTARPTLVVANVDLPCQTGWLVAAKHR